MSKKLKINLVVDNGESNITVYKTGEARPYLANTSHPCWDQIVAGALADDDSIISMFEPGKRLALGERIAYDERLGTLYFDGDEVADELGAHILAAVGEGHDHKPLVALFENIKANPNPGSQEQLYRWIKTHKLATTPDGLIIGYKSVASTEVTGKPWTSLHAGPAIVNGEPHTDGPVPQGPGDVVEMPRSQVTYDPDKACSHGLHVGNWDFAHGNNGGFGGTATTVLEIHVNPRDVVSVPRHAGDAKIRVCRYKVVGLATDPHKQAVVPYKVTAFDKLKAAAALKANANTALTKRVRYPSQTDFEEMQARAKRRRRNFTKYALKHTTWTLIQDRDGTDRKDWTL